MNVSGELAPTQRLPFEQVILKVYERCNLACDYCYIYEMADTTWLSRPSRMEMRTAKAVAERLLEHVRLHDLKHVTVVLHGGEPLMAGSDFCVEVTELMRSTLTDVRVDVSMQTNGLLLKPTVLESFRRHDIAIGVSLDGDAVANDRHRRFRSGKSSHERVVKGLEHLTSPAYRHLFSGLLCTIDVANDPLRTYNSLLQFDPPAIDFLLPHGNWQTAPPDRNPDGSTPYADWLIPIFDEWFSSGSTRTSIRFFQEIMVMLLGGHSRVETIGLTPVGMVVVETDGTYEQVDSLKSAFDGAAATGLNVFDNTFDEVAALPSIIGRRSGIDALSAECRSCPIVDVCGGGYYPHRFGSDGTFDHRSVYCADLYALITHIRTTIAEALARSKSNT